MRQKRQVAENSLRYHSMKSEFDFKGIQKRFKISNEILKQQSDGKDMLSKNHSGLSMEGRGRLVESRGRA